MKMDQHSLADRDAALYELLCLLRAGNYRFVTPTPATHARVISRADRQRARSIEDVLGWSLPFEPDVMPGDLLSCLRSADMVSQTKGGLRSRVRVSSLEDKLFLHSAYPTDSQDAVFFGPDTYRFVSLVTRELASRPPCAGACIVDIGAGTGAGAILAAGLFPGATVMMTDINPAALRFARINAAAAGVKVEISEGPGLAGIPTPVDVAIINPPYIIDQEERAYRDGGKLRGAELALSLTHEAIDGLARKGRVILYTGSAIHEGRDELYAELCRRAQASDCELRYSEIDPDVFGEELDRRQYADVDRIALVAAIITGPE